MSCFCVSTGEMGIVESMGKFDYVAEPGCHCLGPTKGLGGKISLRVQSINCRVDSKTKDNALVIVSASVQYKVLEHKVQEAYYRFANPTAQIQSFASNVIRGQVPKHTIDEVFVIRDEIQKALKEELDEAMASYGFNIIATLITDIDPIDEIKQAMSQINTNARLRVAAGYEADTQKMKVVKAAEADAEAKRLSGVGLAEQRKAAVAGLQYSVETFKENVKGMGAKDVMGLLMMNQYFDALKDIASTGRGNVVFLQGNSGGEVMEGMLAAGAARVGGGGAVRKIK